MADAMAEQSDSGVSPVFPLLETEWHSPASWLNDSQENGVYELEPTEGTSEEGTAESALSPQHADIQAPPDSAQPTSTTAEQGLAGSPTTTNMHSNAENKRISLLQTVKKKAFNLKFGPWFWEISSLAISLAGMVATVGILWVFMDKTLSHWPLHRITLNAVLSILSILIKAPLLFVVTQSLSQAKWLLYSPTTEKKRNHPRRNQPHSLADLQTFDDASRGPWGSLQLVFKKPTAFYGVWGSIVIILATALDPFFQQLVTYPSHRQFVTVAYVGKSQNYTRNSTPFYFADGTIDSDNLGNLPDRSILKAIYAGIFGDPTQVEPVCPTGNCDFDPVQSLALCSRCITGTGYLTNETLTSPGNLSWPFSANGPSDTSNVGVWSPDANATIADMISPLAGFARFPPLLSSDPTWGHDPEHYKLGGPVQCTECALYFCVNTYNILTWNGATSWNVISSWTNDTQRNPSDNIVLKPPPDRIPHYLGAELTPIFIAQPRQLSQYLTKQLTTTSGSPNDLLAQVSMADDVTAMMADVARSVSATIMNKNRNAEKIKNQYMDTSSPVVQNGVSWEMMPIIKVHWEWLSLHLLLPLLSMVFLVMVKSSCKHARSSLPGIWKTSLLGLLFCRMECENTDFGLRNGSRSDDMVRMAKSIDVHLELCDNEWAFREKRRH
ncbi:hypothetical protein PHISCL_09617 [Aspergillus sclerotialis]|uniref:Uncharacterized protein n=1 Tax=Aspergillus sclerotialis TaxID=2070753 RepID=A0A3A2Z767_9EURO|nr:hypothetical protein PHISCL_09617 [Aspergillus sclerotialis]